jgi:hypothetical protein
MTFEDKYTSYNAKFAAAAKIAFSLSIVLSQGDFIIGFE